MHDDAMHQWFMFYKMRDTSPDLSRNTVSASFQKTQKKDVLFLMHDECMILYFFWMKHLLCIKHSIKNL